jgi:hypothetical protein
VSWEVAKGKTRCGGRERREERVSWGREGEKGFGSFIGCVVLSEEMIKQ